MAFDYHARLREKQIKDGLAEYEREHGKLLPTESPWRFVKPLLTFAGYALVVALAIAGMAFLLPPIANSPLWPIALLLAAVLVYLHAINQKLAVLAARAQRKDFEQWLAQRRLEHGELP